MMVPSIIVSDADYIRLMALPSPPELRAELERAIVVPSESMSPSIVSMHSVVSYRDEESGRLREVELVFPDEANPALGKVSVFAPVGAALIGLAVGESIEWDFPDGTPHRLCVLAVKPPLPPPAPSATH